MGLIGLVKAYRDLRSTREKHKLCKFWHGVVHPVAVGRSVMAEEHDDDDSSSDFGEILLTKPGCQRDGGVRRGKCVSSNCRFFEDVQECLCLIIPAFGFRVVQIQKVERVVWSPAGNRHATTVQESVGGTLRSLL